MNIGIFWVKHVRHNSRKITYWDSRGLRFAFVSLCLLSRLVDIFLFIYIYNKLFRLLHPIIMHHFHKGELVMWPCTLKSQKLIVFSKLSCFHHPFLLPYLGFTQFMTPRFSENAVCFGSDGGTYCHHLIVFHGCASLECCVGNVRGLW